MSRYHYTYSLYNPPYRFSLNFVGHSAVNDVRIFQYDSKIVNVLDTAKSFSSINDLSLYPLAIRYAIPEKNFYVIERPPFQVDIDFSLNTSYRSRRHLKTLQSRSVWVPWTVTIIHYDKDNFHYYIYFNDSPLSSFDDIIVPCYLPNTDTSGRICLGQDSGSVNSIIRTNPSDITAIYNQAFNSYFSMWNSDLRPTFYYTDYIAGIYQKIITENKVPYKNYKLSSLNQYAYPNAMTLKNILITMSYMNLDETLSYISSVKSHYLSQISETQYAKSSFIIPLRAAIDRYPLLNPYSEYNDNYHKYFDINTDFDSSNNELTKDATMMRSSVYVHYNQTYSNDNELEDPEDYIDNPFIISQVYNMHYSKHISFLHGQTNSRKFFENISLNLSDIKNTREQSAYSS